MERIKKGDEIIVIAGKDKGRRGTVTRTYRDGRVLVEGINMVRKHMKPNPQTGSKGGIVDREMPLHASNVLHYNGVTRKGDRIGTKRLEDGRKVRFFRSTDELVDI
ncbi:MAG TPA: 50S ribosomal protein L24 [Gammaproteobacteria bacterium]|nr:50S ribosomal protein L24 [Gammaproteobacteria bacterium]